MVSYYMEGHMSVDTIFAKAVEKMAAKQGKDLKSLAHKVMQLSTDEVSVREFRRISRPDKKGRLRSMTLREAYEFSRELGETIETMIALGMREE